MAGHLTAVERALARLPEFDAVSTQQAIRAVADASGVKGPTLIHAIRVAVTGRASSPGLFEVLALVGREATRARLQAAIDRLSPARD
jgi:glutamyl-tRNA synthetase